MADGVNESAITERYYEPPLINIIKYACHACPDTHYEVTQACQGCLAKHCYQSCPKGAIELTSGSPRSNAAAISASLGERVSMASTT